MDPFPELRPLKSVSKKYTKVLTNNTMNFQKLPDLFPLKGNAAVSRL